MCQNRPDIGNIIRYPVEAPQSCSAPESTRPKLSRRAAMCWVDAPHPVLSYHTGLGSSLPYNSHCAPTAAYQIELALSQSVYFSFISFSITLGRIDRACGALWQGGWGASTCVEWGATTLGRMDRKSIIPINYQITAQLFHILQHMAFWQFFYYCPSSIQRERSLKCDAKNLTSIS